MGCETMKYGKALDFLLFSYFGCDCKADEGTMKNSVAHRAYLDLARTVKFEYSSSYIDKHKNEKSVKQCKTIPLFAIGRTANCGTECELQKLVCVLPHKMHFVGFAFFLASDSILFICVLTLITSVPSGISRKLIRKASTFFILLSHLSQS